MVQNSVAEDPAPESLSPERLVMSKGIYSTTVSVPNDRSPLLSNAATDKCFKTSNLADHRAKSSFPTGHEPHRANARGRAARTKQVSPACADTRSRPSSRARLLERAQAPYGRGAITAVH
jgi:hypothetical protein